MDPSILAYKKLNESIEHALKMTFEKSGISDKNKNVLHAVDKIMKLTDRTLKPHEKTGWVDYTTISRIVFMKPGGNDDARVIRLGNLKINFKKLMLSCGSGSLLIASGITIHTIAAVLAIVLTVNELYKCFIKEIGEQDATVYWGMWKAKSDKDFIEDNKILTAINSEKGSSPLLAFTDRFG